MPLHNCFFLCSTPVIWSSVLSHKDKEPGNYLSQPPSSFIPPSGLPVPFWQWEMVESYKVKGEKAFFFGLLFKAMPLAVAEITAKEQCAGFCSKHYLLCRQ